MAATLQTALKNAILSVHQSASMIPTEKIHLDNIKAAIALISYSERYLGLTPVTASAALTIRTESEIITELSSILTTLGDLAGDADWADASSVISGAFNNIAGAQESYRIFVN